MLELEDRRFPLVEAEPRSKVGGTVGLPSFIVERTPDRIPVMPIGDDATARVGSIEIGHALIERALEIRSVAAVPQQRSPDLLGFDDATLRIVVVRVKTNAILAQPRVHRFGQVKRGEPKKVGEDWINDPAFGLLFLPTQIGVTKMRWRPTPVNVTISGSASSHGHNLHISTGRGDCHPPPTTRGHKAVQIEVRHIISPNAAGETHG